MTSPQVHGDPGNVLESVVQSVSEHVFFLNIFQLIARLCFFNIFQLVARFFFCFLRSLGFDR